ncbi:MAG: peptidoglycan DD-metalloendopeptidase family protein [Thermodesulfobacteriota bacterium]|nr:peptidoglycan DD-metalloendopeptidase family protein [Thermodesulfobacteriota bacterium]
MFYFLETIFKKLIFFLIICSAFTAVVKAENNSAFNHGVIYAWKLNLRQAPSNDSGVVDILEKGCVVKIISLEGCIGGWLEVEYKNKRGYLRNRPRYVTLVDTPSKENSGQGTENKESEKTPADRRDMIDTEKKASPAPAETETDKRAMQEAKKNKTDNRPVLKAEEIQEKIASQKKENLSFTRKESEIIEGLNEVDRLLNTMRQKISESSESIKRLEAEMEILKKEKERLLTRTEENRAYVSARLNALYRVRMIGQMVLASMPDSFYDFLLQQRALKQILNSDFTLLDRQIQDFEKLETFSEDYKKKKAHKKIVDEQLSDQIKTLKRESLKKKRVLKEIRKEKKLGYAALASLESAALALEQKLERIKKLDRIKEDIDRETGKEVFLSQKQKIKMPVNGEIISTYGPSQNSDYSSFTFQSGIDIKADRGEPVRSVFKGRILYAQWLNGYGNLIIIDHGHNYYTLYAHVEEFFKKKGEAVETSEVIATAGDTGSLKGVCLHFEIRHHGKPVNPLKWLQKGI